MAKKHDGSTDWSQFRGYTRPRYTVVPDELFDEHLPDLSGAELKILLYIIRRTYGFDKDSDNISLNQLLTGITTRAGKRLDRGTGLSKPTLLQALRSLAQKNLIEVTRQQSTSRGNEPSQYRLKQIRDGGADDEMEDDPELQPVPSEPGKKNSPPLDKKVHQGVGQETLPSPRAKKLPTQETVLQQTDFDLRDSNGAPYQQSLENEKAQSRSMGGGETAPTGDQATILEGAGSPPAANYRTHRDFTPVQDILTTYQRAGHQKTLSDAPQSPPRPVPARRRMSGRSIKPSAYIASCIEDFSGEFHDATHYRSNLTQAMNLLEQSGISEDQFVSILYIARSITRQQGGIQKDSTEPGLQGLKNKMPYYFSVVRRELGLDEQPAGSPPSE